MSELRAAAADGPVLGSVASTAGTTTVPTDGTGAIVCTGDGTNDNRVQVLYVVASDRADRFSALEPTLGQYVANADGQFNASARKTGGARHLRLVTRPDGAGCRLDIRKVVIAPSADDTFSASISAVKSAGHSLAGRKYLMFVDADVYCGIGSIYHDDSSGQTNANNGRYAQYARTDQGCWDYAEGHELMHNLGGVQTSAPHATSYNHCWDESDVMCYADGAGSPMQQICPLSQEGLFDCNGDDYFNTAPSIGSYLATHWNVASSSFLLAAAATPPPVDTAPVAPTGVRATPGQGSVVLSWTANGEGDLASYRVLRGGAQIAALGKVTSYTDSGLAAGSTHTYTVRAVDAAGNVSPDSTPVTTTVAAAAAPVVSGARYRVVNVNANKAMETPSLSAGTQLTQRSTGTSTTQRWTFTANADGTWSIRNVASGLCADVTSSSTASGAAVIQWSCHTAANQRWRITAAAAGGFALSPAHSGRCLDVTSGSISNGARLVQSTCSGAARQRWTFTRMS